MFGSRGDALFAAFVEPAGAVAGALERFGRLDVVVCAHGGSGRRFGDGPVDECSEAGWDATLDMNLRSVFLVCRAAVPALRSSGGGAIVTVASVLGLVGGDEDFAYRHVSSEGELAAEYARLVAGLGDVAGFVWTQLTDVEGELNGLLGHDRRPKAPADAIRAANEAFRVRRARRAAPG